MDLLPRELMLRPLTFSIKIYVKHPVLSLSILFQFSSVTQSCPTLCYPMDCSTPGLPVHHQLLEFTQTLIHCVGDAIQPPHPPLLSYLVPFSSCLQSFPASGSFPKSQFFVSGGQISASASVLPMNIQCWFPLGWTGLDLLAVQVTLKSFLQHHSWKASVFSAQLSL